MVWDVLSSAAMGTLRGIMRDRYGMGVDLRFVQNLSDSQQAYSDSQIVGEDLHLPINVGDKFLATAIVNGGGHLNMRERSAVGDVVRLFLEPELFGRYLEQVKNNFVAQDRIQNGELDRDNVVNLYSELSRPEASDIPSKNASSHLFVFESKNPKMLFRLASNIHELSGRWAFLNIKDIQTSISSAADLKSLGTITLVIDDLTQMDPAFQNILAEALSLANPSEEPLFVVGTTTLLDELIQTERISPKLSQILQSYVMDADRLPKDPRLLQESLEIMMEI